MNIEQPGGFYVGAPGYISDAAPTQDAPITGPGVPLNYSVRRGAPNTMLDQPQFVISPPMGPGRTLPDYTDLNTLEFLGINGGLPTFFQPANRAASTVHSGPSSNLNSSRWLLVPPPKYNAADPLRARNTADRGSYGGSRGKARSLSLGGG